MDFNDPELILIKEIDEDTLSYYQVVEVNNQKITISDIEHGSNFKFDINQLIKLYESGKLSSVSIHDVPESLFTNRSRLAAKRRLTIPLMQMVEVERKFAYVKGVLDSNMSGFTEKKLTPFIKLKSVEINDANPPSWRTLFDWIKNYVEAGWDKSGLVSRNKYKGNRNSKLDPELLALIDTVIKNYKKKPNIKYKKVYDEIIEKLKEVNLERVKKGKAELACCGYKTIVEKMKKRRKTTP